MIRIAAFAALVLATAFSVSRNDIPRELEEAQLRKHKGAAVFALMQGLQLGVCESSQSCADGNPDPSCGVTMSGVCVPTVSACRSNSPCRDAFTVVLRCVGFLGICGPPPASSIKCPGPNTGTANWGECVNITAGPNCICVDQGASSGERCGSIQGQC